MYSFCGFDFLFCLSLLSFFCWLPSLASFSCWTYHSLSLMLVAMLLCSFWLPIWLCSVDCLAHVHLPTFITSIPIYDYYTGYTFLLQAWHFSHKAGATSPTRLEREEMLGFVWYMPQDYVFRESSRHGTVS